MLNSHTPLYQTCFHAGKWDRLHSSSVWKNLFDVMLQSPALKKCVKLFWHSQLWTDLHWFIPPSNYFYVLNNPFLQYLWINLHITKSISRVCNIQKIDFLFLFSNTTVFSLLQLHCTTPTGCNFLGQLLENIAVKYKVLLLLTVKQWYYNNVFSIKKAQKFSSSLISTFISKRKDKLLEQWK